MGVFISSQKFLAIISLAIAFLLFSLFPLYSAPAFADTKKETPEEHYTIGEDENTFKGLLPS